MTPAAISATDPHPSANIPATPMAMPLDPELRAEARRLYAAGLAYARIAAQLGLSPSTVGTWARRERWREQAAAASGQPPSAGVPRTVGIRSRLALRLFKVLECRIQMLELRMLRQLQAHERTLADDPSTAGEPPMPSKEERDSFAALIESIHKVTELVSEPATASVPAGKRNSVTAAANPELTALSDDIDADGLAAASAKDSYRREIAERLGKLFPQP